MTKKRKKLKSGGIDDRVMLHHKDGKSAEVIAGFVHLDVATVERIIKENTPRGMRPCPPGLDPEKWAKQQAIALKNRNSVGARVEALAGLVGQQTGHKNKAWRDAERDEQRHKEQS